MSASLQYQDWFTLWETYETTIDEGEALLAFAECFYFFGD